MKSVVCRHQWEVEGLKTINSCGGWAGNFLLMVEIQNKLMNFSNILDLPPCNSSSPLNELLIGMVDDLQKLYPKFVSTAPISATNSTSIYQGLKHFYEAPKFVDDLWAETHQWSNKFSYKKDGDIEDMSLEQLGERVLERLDCMSKVLREIFYPTDEEDTQNENPSDRKSGDFLKDSNLYGKGLFCHPPVTPTSLLPETIQFPHASYSPPFLLPLRLQAVGKLKSTDVKRLSFHMFPHNSKTGNQEEQSNYKALPLEVTVTSEISKTATKAESVYGKVINETPKNQKINSHITTSNKGSGESEVSNMLPKPTALPPPPSPPVPFSSPSLIPNISAMPPPPPPPSLIPNISAMLPFPPPMMPPKGSGPLPPPPMPISKGSTPPLPPPLGVTKALRPKKAHTKLKRSMKMGHLYRLLKGKVEGSSLDGKSSHRRKNQIGGSSGNKAQGMADALAEMTKRSAYFQKIEEDAQKHATAILEMKSAINSFQTEDMSELLKFHQYLELHLEDLTDETQVLARFESFPAKKLETIRTAAALFSKLEAIANNLESWNIVAPLAGQLDKIEGYFNKIKVEVDAMERTKEEESKRLQSHKINFDFNVLTRIKELMVDVSSNCIEMALEESKKTKAEGNGENRYQHNARSKVCSQVLWRAFQLAFRVYNFAGGQDDRADRLTSQLAHEIETYPQR